MTQTDGTPPPPPVKAAKGSPFRRISVIWLVPLIAFVAVIGVAVKTYLDQGPLIQIAFENASGITAGTTELHYRDVTVGMVEDVGFSEGLDSVVVSVRVHKDVASYVDADAQFWVVRPEVTAQGVSGLDTVLSGVYLEGLWDGEPGRETYEFTGLADAPLQRLNDEGVLVTLRAGKGVSLTEGAPIIYQGLNVGRIGKTQISQDGSTAEAEAIIFAPHDRLIDTSTRFWDTSGFSFTLGPGGAALDFSSIASLISGGVTFGTMVSGGEPVEPGATITVYTDEASARASIFSGDEGETLTISAVFEENIAGLAVDAPVELAGLNIGRVSSLNGLVDSERFGDNRVRLIATMAIRPGRLGLEGDQNEETALAFLRERVENGLRARLATTSILTGGLKVELAEVPDAAPATIEDMGDSGLRIPTTESDISDVSATAEGVFQRINDLPVEEVMNQAINLLGNINALITSEGVRNAPENLNGLLADARGAINDEDLRAVPGQINEAVDQLATLIEGFNEAALSERLGKALDDAAEAAQGVNSAVEGVPDLVARIEGVAANIEEVAIDQMADQVTELVTTVDSFLNQQSTRELPASLNGALTELSGVLEELRNSGVVDTAKDTLNSASNAADTFAEASRDLPRLIEQARVVLSQAGTTIEGYQANNGLGRDARNTLREIERAAQAVASLARAIERNPNSLLTGR
ncbi:paraquat-inducible protein B [Roseovarius nanhaiticus]|uniref:Paraquat-inducible protein B n=1 Tax=Roseovarius nanhaiticus TaxID=573024 RepID=A0A1N7EMP8_9RHOB|nr:MlaD family protein [Roseovarius nanhaiticus]SEK71211.1 paraquat-inducible protein B [Roseovarius nanhaiticus]SIR89346.1 paraquat-inducible protein B [Roseovarius nanhaiticus]